MTLDQVLVGQWCNRFQWRHNSNASTMHLNTPCFQTSTPMGEQMGTSAFAIYSFFQLLTHIFKTLPLYFPSFTHKSKSCTHEMQNTSHLLQNEALHSKYHKHISKANICKHLCHNINSCHIFACYIENCVLCFAKSVLWNWKRLRISVWFCRFGVLLLFEWQLSETVWQVKI